MLNADVGLLLAKKTPGTFAPANFENLNQSQTVNGAHINYACPLYNLLASTSGLHSLRVSFDSPDDTRDAATLQCRIVFIALYYGISSANQLTNKVINQATHKSTITQ